MSTTALVIGTGWAGEGHVLGLRSAGVEVKALCGRTRSAVEKRAQEFDIDSTYEDWSEAIDAEK